MLQVNRPGSSVPGPPFVPKRLLTPMALRCAGGIAGLMVATSKDCANAAGIASAKLIFSRNFLGMVHHQDFHWSPSWFQFQSELRLNLALDWHDRFTRT